MDDETLTNQLTSGDKSVRGKICYPFTQPLWWLVYPVRFSISWLIGRIYGKEAEDLVYDEILTPANFLTAARALLLIVTIKMFFWDAPLYKQTELLFWAIITDFLDGPLARNNNEITKLGTYMDHTSDWGIILWVMFITFWYGTIPFWWIAAAIAILPALLFVYIDKFRKMYAAEATLMTNAGMFASEELQTDFWGRIQFFCLCVALFGGLFVASAEDPNFFFKSITDYMPKYWQTTLVELSLIVFYYISGYSTRDALNYSEEKAKKIKEGLAKIKNSS